MTQKDDTAGANTNIDSSKTIAVNNPVITIPVTIIKGEAGREWTKEFNEFVSNQPKAFDETPEELKEIRKSLEVTNENPPIYWENQTPIQRVQRLNRERIQGYIAELIKKCSYSFYINLPFDYSQLLAAFYINTRDIKNTNFKLTKISKQDIYNVIKKYLEASPEAHQIKDFSPGALLSYSTSPALHLWNRILNTSGSDRDLKSKNRNITIEEYLHSKELTVKYTSSNNEITITLDNIDYLTKAKKDKTKKVLIYILSIINNTDIDIVFNLSDLVKLGIYESLESARLGFKKCMDNLLSYKIGGETKKGGKKIRSEKGVIFTYCKIENNMCTVTLNDKINYTFICQYYPCIPVWAFKLNKTAFNLMEYVTYQARQNTKSIRETGKFKIGLETISNHIGLPSPKDTQKHTEKIIDPILTAITALEETQQGTEYLFTPVYNENYKNAVDFLQGYLEIEIKGEMKNKLIEIQNSKEREYKRSIKAPAKTSKK